jgi:hypothetical protein
LQQGLGDGEDAFAVELLPVTELEVLYLFPKDRSAMGVSHDQEAAPELHEQYRSVATEDI